MLCDTVKSYLARAGGQPFFYAVGDTRYNDVLSQLTQEGLTKVRLSDFCRHSDKYPDIDDVIDYLHTLDVDCRSNKVVLLGLGEYLALKGSPFVEKMLRRFNNTTLGNARVVLLLRCVTPQVKSLALEDARIEARNRLFVEDDTLFSISVVCTRYSIREGVAQGVKALLHDFEDGKSGKIHVITDLDFSNALLKVKSINSAYAAVKSLLPRVRIKEAWGTNLQWEHLLKQLNNVNNNIKKLFSDSGFDCDIESILYEKCSGVEFGNWLFFVYLKLNCEEFDNSYLRHVISNTEAVGELKYHVLNDIIYIEFSNPRYWDLYDARKRLVKNFDETAIASFIRENSINVKTSIYHLTDNTLCERRAIIEWVATNSYIEDIKHIYPALAYYLAPYTFDCGEVSESLSRYFNQYRLQKVMNHLNPEFIAAVEQNASNYFYMKFETRDNAVMQIPNRQSSFLYWIDALGLEFLPYITALAKEHGLNMHVDITRVKLPTITEINRDFFENWPGEKNKFKEERLDSLKHKEEIDFDYQPEDAPVHLASELDIIDEAVRRAHMRLAEHKCKSFVIASDHGASRLAVLADQKKDMYETETGGEHSGRCCRDFSDADLHCVVRENGYLTRADYGRYKASRAAHVEVHGGATLEEVLVPVITFTLNNREGVDVRLLEADKIRCDHRTGTRIRLYIEDVENRDNVGVVIDGKRYIAEASDRTHYSALLADIRRARTDINAEVYDGDSLIKTLKFDVQGRLAKVNNKFDDLF